MSPDSTECQRSYATAETALHHIRDLRLPADPQSFELWYAYATGDNPALNRQVAEFIAARQATNGAELDELYRSFVTSSKALSQIASIHEQIEDEVSQIIGMIEAAIFSTATFQSGLDGPGQKLRTGIDRECLRAIVESLVHHTKTVEMEHENLGKGLQLSSMQIQVLTKDLEAAKIQSLIDPLTSLFNRKHFDKYLGRLTNLAKRGNKPFVLILTDIDHFKTFNDSHGHLIGDHVLRLIAMELVQAIKGRGIAARYGGEEFAVILPRADLSSGLEVAMELQKSIAAREIFRRNSDEVLGRITISAGLAEWRPEDSVETLIGRADACLYSAKVNGRNRVVADI